VPFELWHALAVVAEFLPRPPITRGQVELMEIDTVANPTAPGFADLGVRPRELETLLASVLDKT
jgi:hypothetical protein